MREDYIHHEESSVHKTTQFPDKEKDAVLSENGQESLLNEASKEKSPKKRVKVEDHISSKKKKANSDMKGKGMINLKFLKWHRAEVKLFSETSLTLFFFSM